MQSTSTAFLCRMKRDPPKQACTFQFCFSVQIYFVSTWDVVTGHGGDGPAVGLGLSGLSMKTQGCTQPLPTPPSCWGSGAQVLPVPKAPCCWVTAAQMCSWGLSQTVCLLNALWFSAHANQSTKASLQT